MRSQKVSIFLASILAIGILGCAQERKIEIPTEEQIPTGQIATNLVPVNIVAKGSPFSVELSDLKVIIKGGVSSKENVEMPRLKGNIKVINEEKAVRIVNRVALEYLDEAGKPITRESEEKTVIGSSRTQWGWNSWGVGPGQGLEASFDISIPISIIREKSLRKIAVTLVYVAPHMSAIPGQLAWLSSDDSMLLHEEILTLSVMLSDDFNI